MRKIKRDSVLKRAKRGSETKKLYSFRLKKGLVDQMTKEADKEALTLTALIEALFEEYLKLSL